MDCSLSPPAATSDLAQEQVMAEQRKTLTMSMRRKRMPNTMQRYSSHEGRTPPVARQSVQAVSGSPGSEVERDAFQ